LVIRTAMTQSSVHLLYVVPGDGLGMVKLKNPADSAHSDYLLLKTFLRTYGRFQGKSMPKERKALFEMPGEPAYESSAYVWQLVFADCMACSLYICAEVCT